MSWVSPKVLQLRGVQVLKYVSNCRKSYIAVHHWLLWLCWTLGECHTARFGTTV